MSSADAPAPELSIRPADPADVAALTALEAACFGPLAWSAAGIVEELSGPARVVLVATGAGRVVGYGSLSLAGSTADLRRLAVDPALRRAGVGRLLLADLAAAAADRGCATVLLEVAARNAAAVALYTAAGFVPIARRDGYYADGADAVVMRRQLAAAARPRS